MKRVIFSLTIVIATPLTAQETDTAESAAAFLGGDFEMAQTFDCSRKTCGQMRSCAEACHALLVCGDTRRDGDNDGIPCESLCGSRR